MTFQRSEWQEVSAVVSSPYVTRLRTEMWSEYLTDALRLGVSDDPAPMWVRDERQVIAALP